MFYKRSQTLYGIVMFCISMYSGSIFICTQVLYLYVLSCGGEILWNSNLVPLLCPLGQNSTCNWKCQSDIQYCIHSSIPNFTMVQENTLPSSIMFIVGYTWDYTHQSCNEYNKRGEMGPSPAKEPILVQYCMFFFNYTLSM